MLKIAVFAAMPRARCENRNGGEAGAFAEHARSVASVLQEIVEPIRVARVAAGFPGLFHSSECSKRRVASFVARHSRGQVCGDLAIEVEAELVVEFAIDIAFAEERPQPQRQFARPSHRRYS